MVRTKRPKSKQKKKLKHTWKQTWSGSACIDNTVDLTRTVKFNYEHGVSVRVVCGVCVCVFGALTVELSRVPDRVTDCYDCDRTHGDRDCNTAPPPRGRFFIPSENVEQGQYRPSSASTRGSRARLVRQTPSNVGPVGCLSSLCDSGLERLGFPRC